MVLIGDSNAAMYAGAVAQAAARLDRPVAFRFTALCPPADVVRVSDWGVSADRSCNELAAATADRALEAAASANDLAPTVVIGLTGGYWTDNDIRLGTTGIPPSVTLEERSLAMREGLVATIHSLERAGATVVLISPIVTFDDPARPALADRCSTLALLRGTCPEDLPRALAIEGQERARADVKAVAKSNGVTYLDVAAIQCPSGVCREVIDGVPVMNDPSHVSGDFAESLVPVFEDAVSNRGR